MPDQALDSLIGIEFSHYRIIEEIGSGGMGVVFRAHDEHLDREVAIKVLHPGTITDESARKHLHKEALALSKLNHPNIATIFDFDTQRGMDFLVMEYIHGVALNEKLASGPLPENEVLRLGMQLSDGLAAAHEQGVVHRDLKPGNLLLTSDGRLKILDFGLAKLRQPLAESAAAETTLETQSISGTFAYMAPEQLMGEEVDPRTDIHGAGLVLYEMASGQRPFAEVQSGQLIGAILRRPPAKLRTLNPKASSEMERIIGKCLEKEPGNRYQSAKVLAVDLQRLQAGVPAAVKAAEVPVAGRKLWKILIPAALIFVAAAIAGTFYFRSRHNTTRLTDKDTIVLGDFDNKAGDPVFDDALKQALAVELAQSPFLNVVSDRKVAAALQMMGRPADERVTKDLGREICFRTGSKALLGGSIARLGNHFLIDLNAVACASGDTLAREEGKATSKEDVLRVLSQASSSLRRKLGESLPSVRKFDVPFEAATTSLEALKNYSIAKKVLSQQGDAPSIPLFKRAIEFDTNFALAYANLATAYQNLAQPSLALDYATKAYQLRDHATELEKLEISAVYFNAAGELEKEAQTYQLWEANYPGDPIPYANLSAEYSYLGQHEKALVAAQEALRLEPDDVLRYANLSTSYFFLNRLDESKTVLDRALAQKLDSIEIRQMLYILAFLRGDGGQMEQQLGWAAGKFGQEDPFLSMQSDTEAYYGRLGRAREFSRRAVDLATRADSKEAAALWQVNTALREAELGNAALARRGVTAALGLAPGRDVKVVAALTLARIRDSSRAEALAKELAKDYPTNTILKLYWLPTINAAIEVGKGNVTTALANLEPAIPYELGAPLVINNLYPAYVRGQAYLLAHNGAAAVAEFQKMLDHPSIVQNFVTGALVRLQIGRAYRVAGDSAKAKAAYQDFFALWKDADPDIPILIAAKAEYAKLY